ncbi:hypothetical protein EV421DRAFT_1744690 [Armillaria borealis]|uniref:Uncharacterized protein n=1 Tax=Armillaria borealis TaxID=47425 RepID=A0AA39IW06_9AGAR|nr:hypothetical protein EV421DRAFT_1744690 [Armillaria borealis]
MQLIGCFLSLILYGICAIKHILHLLSKGNLASKTVVYVLWLTETIQTIIDIYDTFNTFCYEFGNLSGLDNVISHGSPCLFSLDLLAFAQFGAGICCGIQVRNSGHYSNLQKNSKVKVTAIIWLGASALCDTAIALCMTYLLIRLTIETGTATGWIECRASGYRDQHNANSSLRPEFSQGSESQEKAIGLDDSFPNTGSTADVWAQSQHDWSGVPWR